MLKTLISTLRASNDANGVKDETETRRLNPRRECDRCVSVIHGQTFPVQDWSQGGILIGGDDRLFGVNQKVAMTIKFKLRNTILSVDHNGRVVRKKNGKVAVEFEPLTQIIRHGFQQVIDDHVAQDFANSQAT